MLSRTEEAGMAADENSTATELELLEQGIFQCVFQFWKRTEVPSEPNQCVLSVHILYKCSQAFTGKVTRNLR